jgi:hypothetical protein
MTLDFSAPPRFGVCHGGLLEAGRVDAPMALKENG